MIPTNEGRLRAPLNCGDFVAHPIDREHCSYCGETAAHPNHTGEPMNRYRITSNYGTFEITREVLATDEDEAWTHTGVMADLEAAGWTFTESPDGEDHEVDLIAADVQLPTEDDCLRCGKSLRRVVGADARGIEGTVLVDIETGGDVCGAYGGNEPHVSRSRGTHVPKPGGYSYRVVRADELVIDDAFDYDGERYFALDVFTDRGTVFVTTGARGQTVELPGDAEVTVPD